MNIGCATDPYDRESSLYLMAYLDVLGTTQRIKDRVHADETLNILHNLYAFSTSIAGGDIQGGSGNSFSYFF